MGRGSGLILSKAQKSATTPTHPLLASAAVDRSKVPMQGSFDVMCAAFPDGHQCRLTDEPTTWIWWPVNRHL